MKKIISSILTAVMVITSTTTTYAIDNSVESGSAISSTENIYFSSVAIGYWTNQDIEMQIYAYHTGHTIEQIIGPDGTIHTGTNKILYTLTENGRVSYSAVSSDGSSRSSYRDMYWIDRVNPTIESVVVEDGYIIVNADDDLSGVDGYSFDGGKTFQSDNYKEFDDTLIYTIVVKDDAENRSDSVTYCEQNHRITVEDNLDIMLSSTLDFKDIEEVYDKLELTDIATMDLRLTSTELNKDDEISNLLAVEELIGNDDIIGGFTLDLNQIVAGKKSKTYNDLDRTITLWMDFPTSREHYVVLADDGNAEFLNCWVDSGLKAFQTESLKSFYVVAGYDNSTQDLIIIDHENQEVETLEVTRGQVITVIDYAGNVSETFTIDKYDDIIILSEPILPQDTVFTGWAVGVTDDGNVIVSPGYSDVYQEIEVYDYNKFLVDTIYAEIGQKVLVTDEDRYIIDRFDIIENHGEINLPEPYLERGEALDYWLIEQDSPVYIHFTPVYKSAFESVEITDADGETIVITDMVEGEKVIVKNSEGEVVQELTLEDGQNSIQLEELELADDCIVESWEIKVDDDYNVVLTPVIKIVEETPEQETPEQDETKPNTNKPVIVVKPTTTPITMEDLLNIELEVENNNLTELEFDMDKLEELLEKDGQSIEFLSQKVIPYTVEGGKEIIAKISSYENGEIKFIPPTAGVYNLKINDKYFVDTIGNEYEESIAYTTSREILVGTSFEIFNTEREITRAEFYEVLYRKLANSKKYEMQVFEDVKENMYYFNSSAWAKDNNLVEASEKFLPNEVITVSEITEVLNSVFDLNLSYESDELFNRDEWTLFIYEINKLLLN